MPRPVEDRSDVGGAAQFNNIGPVPLSVPLSARVSSQCQGGVGDSIQTDILGPIPSPSELEIVSVLSRLLVVGAWVGSRRLPFPRP